jgi:hypothetical protein
VTGRLTELLSLYVRDAVGPWRFSAPPGSLRRKPPHRVPLCAFAVLAALFKPTHYPTTEAGTGRNQPLATKSGHLRVSRRECACDLRPLVLPAGLLGRGTCCKWVT